MQVKTKNCWNFKCEDFFNNVGKSTNLIECCNWGNLKTETLIFKIFLLHIISTLQIHDNIYPQNTPTHIYYLFSSSMYRILLPHIPAPALVTHHLAQPLYHFTIYPYPLLLIAYPRPYHLSLNPAPILYHSSLSPAPSPYQLSLIT